MERKQTKLWSKITKNLESDPWSGISQLKKRGRVSVRDSQWDQMRRGALQWGNKQSKLKHWTEIKIKYCLLLKWSLNIHPVDFLRNLFHYFHLSWRWVVHQLSVTIGQRRFSKNSSTVFVCFRLPWIDRLAGWNASVLCWPAAWNKAGIIKPV